MDNPLISIIIPIYKVEKYLDRCINSVVNQTYHNLEIILVDDGSPDNCPLRCDEWAKRDSRIKVIHKINEGLSSARNIGLDVCNGEYVCFVDSDDWLAADLVGVLLEVCKKNRVRLAVCGRYDIYDKQNIKTIGKKPHQDRVIDAKTAVPQMLVGTEFDCSAWGKLYHRSLWQTARFPFGKIYEDIAILYKVVLSAEHLALVSKPLYYYFRHSESITGSAFTEALLDYPSNTRAMLQDIYENYNDFYEYACWAHTKAIKYVLERLAQADKNIYRDHKVVFKKLTRELYSYKSIWNTSAVFSRKDIQFCCIFSCWYIIRPFMQLKNIRKMFK